MRKKATVPVGNVIGQFRWSTLPQGPHIFSTQMLLGRDFSVSNMPVRTSKRCTIFDWTKISTSQGYRWRLSEEFLLKPTPRPLGKPVADDPDVAEVSVSLSSPLAHLARTTSAEGTDTECKQYFYSLSSACKCSLARCAVRAVKLNSFTDKDLRSLASHAANERSR